MRINKRIAFISTLLGIIFFAPEAFAAVHLEYITHGGYDAITMAFARLGLIFSDTNYKSLFYVIIVMGIMIAGFTAYFRILTGAKGSLGAWAWQVGLGVGMYLAFVVPQGTLTVYDDLLNKGPQDYSMPVGIVAVAGTLNKIQVGIEDIISTSADPDSYQQQAGGLGFNALLGMQDNGVRLPDANMQLSLYQYTQDCVVFEMQRPGSTIDINALNNNNDFRPIFELAASNAVFTQLNGVTASCATAWTAINLYLSTPTNFASATADSCANMGFDPTNPTSMNQCQGMIGNLYSSLTGNTQTSDTIFRQAAMAQQLDNVIMSGNTDLAIQTMANRNSGNSMMSTGMMANNWVPMFIAGMTAITFGLLPIFFLFIPTPLWSKVLVLVAGLFVWLTMWTIVDAIVHSFAMSYASHVFQEIKQYNLGLVAVSNFSTAAEKTLAVFGMMRWSAMGLSTMIVGGLMKFGGSAMVGLGQSMQGAAGGAAASAATLATPEGKGQELSALASGQQTMGFANQFKFNDRVAAGENTMANQFGAGKQMGGMTHGAELGKATTQYADGELSSQKAHHAAAQSQGFKGSFDEFQTSEHSAAINKKYLDDQGHVHTQTLDGNGNLGFDEIKGKGAGVTVGKDGKAVGANLQTLDVSTARSTAEQRRNAASHGLVSDKTKQWLFSDGTTDGKVDSDSVAQKKSLTERVTSSFNQELAQNTELNDRVQHALKLHAGAEATAKMGWKLPGVVSAVTGAEGGVGVAVKGGVDTSNSHIKDAVNSLSAADRQSLGQILDKSMTTEVGHTSQTEHGRKILQQMSESTGQSEKWAAVEEASKTESLVNGVTTKNAADLVNYTAAENKTSAIEAAEWLNNPTNNAGALNMVDRYVHDRATTLGVDADISKAKTLATLPPEKSEHAIPKFTPDAPSTNMENVSVGGDFEKKKEQTKAYIKQETPFNPSDVPGKVVDVAKKIAESGAPIPLVSKEEVDRREADSGLYPARKNSTSTAAIHAPMIDRITNTAPGTIQKQGNEDSSSKPAKGIGMVQRG